LALISSKKFAVELENRLNAVFAGEGSKSGLNQRPFSNGHSVTYPLHNLKVIVLNMDWEITDDLIRQYLRQLMHLKDVFRRDRHISLLIKLQYFVIKHIKICKENAHPYAFRLLNVYFFSMDKIISSKNMTEQHKKQILDNDLKKYGKLQKLIAFRRSKLKRRAQNPTPKKSRHNRSGTVKSGSPVLILNYDNKVFKGILASITAEMKRFIRRELNKLKTELQMH